MGSKRRYKFTDGLSHYKGTDRWCTTFLDSKIYCKVHTVTILWESIEGAGEEQSSIDQSTHSLLTLLRILLLNTIRGLRWVLLHQVSSAATSNNNSETMTGTVTMLQQLSSDSPTQPNDTTRSSTNMPLLTNAYQLIHWTTNTVHRRKAKIKIKRSLIFCTKEQHLYEVNCETNCDSQQIDSWRKKHSRHR